ncbi:MAG: hypothetical protein SGJ15_00190, partial [Bacteroidota bacterium]|nr:hypothetical protein [Bacteroidota bacterium]
MMEIKNPSTGSLSACSYVLLRQAFTNNDDNQQENIFITARHCVVKSAINPSNNNNNNKMDLANAKFVFNYSNADASPTSTIGCKVSRYVVEGGATIVDISYLHDIVVLKLNQPIPPHFKPFYSGWTA